MHSAGNIEEQRERARRRLPRALFDFIDRGAEDETAQPACRKAFQDIRLRPRVMVDVSGCGTATQLFGRQMPAPIIIAPTGIGDLLWHGGEMAMARAAARLGLPLTLSASSTTPVEVIAGISPETTWQQIYLWEDRALSLQLMERAQAAGVKTLVLTVDTAVAANREYNRRNGFVAPFRLTPRILADFIRHPSWISRVLLKQYLSGTELIFANYPPSIRSRITSGPQRQTKPASLTWADLDWVRSVWPGTLIVKGILNADDAKHTVVRGADGIVVSNHGGRTLDSAVLPIFVLPEIVEAVGDNTTILFDGGIQRGSDIVKALALGAHAVLVGRAALYGLATAGEQGTYRSLELLQSELLRTMALLGLVRIEELRPDLLKYNG